MNLAKIERLPTRQQRRKALDRYALKVPCDQCGAGIRRICRDPRGYACPPHRLRVTQARFLPQLPAKP